MSTFRVEVLRKSYGGVTALDGATVEAPLGSVHALLGENGAGKSTVSRILSGVIGDDGGTVSLGETELKLGSPRASRTAGIRTAFQELALVPHLTVAENLTLHDPPRSSLRHLRRREAARRAAAHLAAIGVDELVHIDVTAQVRTLGLVERHLIEVARALAMRPSVLILDEATSALPARESAWVLERARATAKDGAAVLFISHRLDEVRAVADTVTILRTGRTVAEGRMDEFDDDRLISEMLGRRVERLYPPRPSLAPSPAMVKVRDLTCAPSVGPISLDIHGGEILGLGGLEGQGQRAFMLALAGVIDADGEITLEGERFAPQSPADALDALVAFVPEDRQAEGLFLSKATGWNLSVGAIGTLANGFGFVDRGKESAAVREEAERMDVQRGRLHLPVGALSGGNQQKVILGRVMMSKPRVLLLHDCTRGVDVGTKAEIYRLMRELADDGVAIVYYSSDLSETVNLCNRVAIFIEGRVAKVVGQEALTEDAILRVSVGRADVPALVAEPNSTIRVTP